MEQDMLTTSEPFDPVIVSELSLPVLRTLTVRLGEGV